MAVFCERLTSLLPSILFRVMMFALPAVQRNGTKRLVQEWRLSFFIKFHVPKS